MPRTFAKNSETTASTGAAGAFRQGGGGVRIVFANPDARWACAMVLLGGFALLWAGVMAAYGATVDCRGTECAVDESWLRLRSKRTFRTAPVLGIEAKNGAVVLSTQTGPITAIAPIVTRSLDVRVQWAPAAYAIREGRATVTSRSFGLGPGCMLLALAVIVGRRQYVAIDRVEQRLVVGWRFLGWDRPVELIPTNAIHELHVTESDSHARIVVVLEGDIRREIRIFASSSELVEAERLLRDALV